MFQFVNLTHPKDASSQKKKVRSHASRNPAARQQRVKDYQKTKDKLRKQEEAGNRTELKQIVLSTSLVPTSGTVSVAGDGGKASDFLFARNGHDLIQIMHKAYYELEKVVPILTVLSATRADPFDTLGRPLGHQESFLLDRFAQNVTVDTHICVPFPSREAEIGFRNLITRQWIQMAAADEGMMATIFLSTCRNLQKHSGEDRFSTMALQYKLKTIRAINMALSQAPEAISDNTLTMALALSAEASSMGDLVAAKQHLEAVEHMVELRGGKRVEEMNASISKMVVWFFKDPILKKNFILTPTCAAGPLGQFLEADVPADATKPCRLPINSSGAYVYRPILSELLLRVAGQLPMVIENKNNSLFDG